MCKVLNTIAKNSFGTLTYCSSCDHFKLSFSNMVFSFTATQLEKFKNYINDVPVDYWMSKNYTGSSQRKIPIHTAQHNLTLMFNRQEFDLLLRLVNIDADDEKLLSLLEIDCDLYLN